MSDTFGLFVSNEGKDVLKAEPQDLSFSSDLNMFKVKQEVFSTNAETVDFDHSLGYWPFFISYGSTGSFVNNWSGQIIANGFMYVCYNPGITS